MPYPKLLWTKKGKYKTFEKKKKQRNEGPLQNLNNFILAYFQSNNLMLCPSFIVFMGLLMHKFFFFWTKERRFINSEGKKNPNIDRKVNSPM